MTTATDSSDPALKEGFRSAMRGLAKGVVVISTRGDGSRHAMAATAVTSLSFDPPSMLICVNRTASIYPSLAAGSGFYVNILSRADESLAALCSGELKGENRFQSHKWEIDSDELPYVPSAQAFIACANDCAYEYGSHGIFIGRVLRVGGSGECDPLIYVDGRYTGLQLLPTNAST